MSAASPEVSDCEPSSLVGMLTQRVLWDLQTLFVYRQSYLPVDRLCRSEHFQIHQLEGRSWMIMNLPYLPELVSHRRYLRSMGSSDAAESAGTLG